MARARGARREGGGIQDNPGARPRRIVRLATVALLHVPLVGMALLHAQGPRSVE